MLDVLLDLLFIGDPSTLILRGFAFLIAFPSVIHYVKNYPSEKSYKYIPAIVSFILTVYSLCLLTYGADIFLTDLIFIFLIIIIFPFSIVMFILSLSIAAYFDIVSFIKNKRRVEKDEL